MCQVCLHMSFVPALGRRRQGEFSWISGELALYSECQASQSCMVFHKQKQTNENSSSNEVRLSFVLPRGMGTGIEKRVNIQTDSMISWLTPENFVQTLPSADHIIILQSCYWIDFSQTHIYGPQQDGSPTSSLKTLKSMPDQWHV